MAYKLTPLGFIPSLLTIPVCLMLNYSAGKLKTEKDYKLKI